MTTILESLLRNAAETPEKTFALHLRADSEQGLSFGDLLKRSLLFRDQLAKVGVRPGDVVLIILKHGLDQYPSFLGAMLLGAVPSFMPFRTPKQDPERYWSSHRQLFQRIGAQALITFRENLDAIRTFLPDADLTILAVEDLGEAGLPPLPETLAQCAGVQACPESVAFLQHSSGTTGLKKGVMLSHGAVLRQLAAYGQALGMEPGHRIASWLPLYHDMGLIACFLGPMVTGNTVVALDPFEWAARPALLLDAIQRHRCHFVWMPNFAFHHLARCAPEGETWDLSSIRAFINCSEPCKPEAFDVFLARFQGMGLARESLQVCYAMAETVFAVTQTPLGGFVPAVFPEPSAMAAEGRIVPREHGPGLLSCGRPVPGTQVEIRDGSGEPLGEDRVGEVVVASACLFDGYFRLPELTAERLKDGALWTGDMGFLHGGELFITGRRDDQITIYGQNYYAHDLEGCLNDLPGITPGRCVAAARPNPTQSSSEAVVIAEADQAADAGALRRAIKQRVLDTLGLMVAEVALVPMGWLVKTTSGKLSREANLRKLSDTSGRLPGHPLVLNGEGFHEQIHDHPDE